MKTFSDAVRYLQSEATQDILEMYGLEVLTIERMKEKVKVWRQLKGFRNKVITSDAPLALWGHGFIEEHDDLLSLAQYIRDNFVDDY